MPDTSRTDPMTLKFARPATHSRLAGALLRIRAHAHTGSDDDAGLAGRLKQIAELADDAVNGSITEIRHEYGVWWHGPDDTTAIRLDQEHIGSLEQARLVGPQRIGTYGITHFTIVYCTHVIFSDHSTWISSWQPVDDTPAERSPHV